LPVTVPIMIDKTNVLFERRVIPHMIRNSRRFPRCSICCSMVVVQFDFDERDPLYRCCFELLHIRRGAQILAVFNAILGISMFSAFFFWDFDVLFAIIQVAQGAIQASSAVLMLIAVKILKPRLVIPYLAAQLLMLFTTASFFVIFIITVYFPDDVGNFIFEILKISKAQVDKIEEDWGHEGYIFILRLGGFSMNVLCFFLFCFELWTLRVSFQCYNYLLDVFDAREGTNRLPPLRMERNGQE
ncbi:hypothetical protein PRIPAC_89308, partial [Pristionchus pacificus]